MLDMAEVPAARRDPHRRAARGRRARRGAAARHRRGRLGAHRGARAAARGARRRAASRPERVLVLTRSRAARARLRERGRAAARSPLRGALDRHLRGGRRARCCASTRSRPGSTRSSPPSAPPTGWRCCSTGSTSCRCAATRSAATRPACSPGCCAAIDLLKAEARDPGRAARVGGGARARAASAPAERERAEREIEFAELYARHDRILREAGSLDAGDLVLELGRLLREPRRRRRASSPSASATCSPTSSRTPALAHRALLEALASHGNLVCACDPRQATRRFRGAGDRAAARGAFRRRGRLEPAALARDRPRAAIAGGEPPAGSTARFWRCATERAQAQAAAREIEHLLAAGEVRPERICVIAGSGWREGRLVAAALEERSVPFRYAGDAAFFQRPEVRDVLAWLRMLADPTDSAAVVRALTRPPVELRSVDLARCTTIARRRKLDMISALEAALESPQLPPEARDRIQAFLRLHRAASAALEEMRADVFVRRLIERIGLRRHRLFAASPETAERLVNLSRLAELAADWSRREPRGSVRDFVRHLTAVAEAGELGGDDCDPPSRRACSSPSPSRSRGSSSTTSTCSACAAARSPRRDWEDGWIPAELLAERAARARRRADRRARACARLPGDDPRRGWRSCSRGRSAAERGPARAVARSTRPLARRSAAEEEFHEEELFGPPRASTPPTGCSATRCSRRRGGRARRSRRCASTPPRTSTPRSRATSSWSSSRRWSSARARSRPPEALDGDQRAARPGRLARAAGALEASALDEYVLGEERERGGPPRAGRRPARALAGAVHPAPQATASALSASDIDLYRTCPLKYKFARVFAIPQEPTINQRFGILIHQVLERFHTEELRADARRRRSRSRRPAGGPRPPAGAVRGRLAAHRASAPPTTSSSTATAPSPRSPATTSATCARSRSPSGWSAASPSRSARTSSAAGSTASTSTPTAATS